MRLVSGMIVLFAIVSMAVLGSCGGGGGGGAEPIQAPGIFSLTAPADGATGVDRQPALTWQASAGASGYALLVADNPAFASPIVDQVALGGTSYTLPTPLEGSTPYFWRVTATNADGTTRCSADFAFTTAAAPQAPGNFSLTAPADGATEVNRQPTLSWQAAAGADAYTLWVADNPEFATPVVHQVALSGTSYPLPTLLAGSTAYFWRVSATNAVGTTQCSADFDFTTRALAPPTIVEHPRSLNVAAGHSIELTVGATGLAPMSYQWQRLDGSVWSDIDDAVGQSLTVPPMAAEDGAVQIRCMVTNTDGQAASSPATLNVRRVLMVNLSAAGLGNGTSWSDAFTNLQGALTSAATGIDEIWVAAGTYTPGALRTDAFQLVANVGVYGGFNGTETAREDRDQVTNQTTLSGEIGGVGISDNAYHVVRGANAATLDGFTVTGGNADSSFPNGNGGGMYNDSVNPIVTNCTFSGNSAFLGGGMQNNSCSPTVSNCTFSDNSATNGGGLHSIGGSPTVTNCTFSGNTSGGNGAALFNDGSSARITNCTFSLNSTNARGGGMHSTGGGTPIITGCTFNGNSAAYGGGMCNEYYSNPVITGCTFSNNSAVYRGGGMLNSFDGSNPTISNSVFSQNTAEYGGGMYNNYPSTPTVNNCTFSANSAAADGGGMYNFGNSAMTFANCTFSNNSAVYHGGGMYNDTCNPIVTNGIFSENSTQWFGGGMYNYSSSPTLTNCTFGHNSAVWDGGGMSNYEHSSPTVINSILWGNTAASGESIFNNANSTSVAMYSCIQGGHAGAGNIVSDPLFVVSDVPADLRLEAGSPCIDAADGSVAPTLDILGNARWDDPGTPNTGVGTPPPDMGAFEYIVE